MGCMVLYRTFHTAPEQVQGPTAIVPYYSGSGSGPGHNQCDYTIKFTMSDVSPPLSLSF